MPATVLVVEDDPHIAVALRELFVCEGFAAIIAADGASALEHLRARAGVDVVLLDMRMPGMDGRAFLAARRLDPALAAIPVVVFSGGDPAAEVDVFAKLYKPADPDAILDAVRRAVAGVPRLAKT
jgi:CheY-like chemotaxis protein